MLCKARHKIMIPRCAGSCSHCAFIAAPATAQTTVPAAAAGCCGSRARGLDPAAPYITNGQDEPGYRSWYLAAPWRSAQVKSFNDYLVTYQVSGIVPTWQLLRTATAWKDCGGQPFEVPPTSDGRTSSRHCATSTIT